MKDRDGRLMRDKYLVEKVSEHDSRLAKVYDTTSGYIHLSSSHISNAIRLKGEDGSFQVLMNGTVSFETNDAYGEMILGFTTITQLLLELIQKWWQDGMRTQSEPVARIQ